MAMVSFTVEAQKYLKSVDFGPLSYEIESGNSVVCITWANSVRHRTISNSNECSEFGPGYVLGTITKNWPDKEFEYINIENFGVVAFKKRPDFPLNGEIIDFYNGFFQIQAR